MNIQLLPQESACNARFDSPVYMTIGFQSEFGEMAPIIVQNTLHKIRAERVLSKSGADYLQAAFYKSVKYWIIDSESYITFLLPHEY
jgi:hypothetical protein